MAFDPTQIEMADDLNLVECEANPTYWVYHGTCLLGRDKDKVVYFNKYIAIIDKTHYIVHNDDVLMKEELS